MINNNSKYLSFVRLFGCVLVFSAICLSPREVFSQDRGDRKLFEQDKKKIKKQENKKREAIRNSVDAPLTTQVKLQAPKLSFDKDKNIAAGSGGIVVSYGAVKVEGESGDANLTSKDVKINERMSVTHSGGSIVANEGVFNLESETGNFKDSQFQIEEGGYTVSSARTEKLTEFDYRLKDSVFSTCNCADGYLPWSIDSDSADITDEGYAYTYGTTLYFYNMPFFYSPFFAFPAKKERATGLLVPEFTVKSRDGFRYKQPLFVVLNDATDFTVSPFTETSSRVGSSFEFRKVFSQNNTLRTRWYASDESKRIGSWRGVLAPDGTAPNLSENRSGGFLEHIWISDPENSVPLSYVADIHYVSDDLFLREIDDNDIGLRSSPNLTSSVALSAGLGNYMVGSVAGEYNQDIKYLTKDEDKAVLQRLPELSLSGMRSIRPFGYNPYGLKVVTKGSVTETFFDRDLGITGNRLNVKPGLAVPFHYKNYFYGGLDLDVYETRYNTSFSGDSSLAPPPPPDDIADPDKRRTFIAKYKMSTQLEKVYDVEEDGFLDDITTFSPLDRGTSLRRVKHVLEPMVGYTYIPDIADLEDKPYFDSIDRIRNRSYFSYGLRSSLLGRFQTSASQDQIEDITPTQQDLPTLDYNSPFVSDNYLQFRSGRPGYGQKNVREIMDVSLTQLYDFVEKAEDEDPGRGPFSDYKARFIFTPSSRMLFDFDSDIRSKTGDLSRWSSSIIGQDNRGDLLKLSYSYTDSRFFDANRMPLYLPNTSQLSVSAELSITERLKLGMYGIYDGSDRELIEDSVALRIFGGCNCWHFDIGVSERSNPDNTAVQFRFSLHGLGEIKQNLLSRRDDDV